MTKPSNLGAIADGTGRAWDDWVELLDSKGARELTHPEIVVLANTELTGVVDNVSWWAQNVTVAYEQFIGKRVPGQVADGTFEVASSRTLPGTKEDVMALFDDAYGLHNELRDIPILSSRRSGTDKRLYWKAELADGSRCIAATEPKGTGKAMIVVTHIKVATGQDAESWRLYWKTQLAKL